MSGGADPSKSYRQKGGKVEGEVVKGTPASAFIKKSVGSVPSKYETIVYMHKSSKQLGFGSNAERFEVTQKAVEEEENPGPGSYLKEAHLSKMNNKSDSLSRKGLGNGFVSKTDRFKNNSLWQ